MSGASPSTRPLTTQERELARWMLEHGSKEALSFLTQLESAQATLWCCPCGCASFNLALKEKEPNGLLGLHILADFVFGSEEQLSGIFIFERAGALTGLEVYGLTGDAPKYLPAPEDLRPFPTQ